MLLALLRNRSLPSWMAGHAQVLIVYLVILVDRGAASVPRR